MNDQKIKELAEEAGFIYWENEEWGPGPGFIDWSSNYDNELVKYTELVVRECAGVCDLYAMPDGTSELAMMLSSVIKSKFGLKDEV